ncbi:MAG: ABC transporter permease [Trueperaceae bacterium]|nr:MAG: ABC transporter permease [Trueperaceae bacterium]
MKDLLRRIWLRKSAAIGLVGVLVVTVVAVFAPLIVPQDPNRQDLFARLQPPNAEHLLGTDNFGRDQLSRLIYGARISLTVGVVAVLIAAALGSLLGLVAGYFGGLVDNLLMRLIDVLMAFPTLLLAIVFLAMLGERVGGLLNIMIAVGIASTPHFARLVRGQVLSIKQLDYVEAARALGGSAGRLMTRHILVNSLSPIIIYATLRIATVILTEASLSFLGLGVPPPTPTWGGMVAEGTKLLQRAPWLSLIPGVAIMMTVLAFNLFGDGLRDALDPRLRGIGDVAAQKS